jgi:uncharacterized membrane protein
MNSMWKNYGLYVSVASLLFLLVKDWLKLETDTEWNQIINAVLGILVTAGILSNPKDSQGYINKNAIDLNEYNRL